MNRIRRRMPKGGNYSTGLAGRNLREVGERLNKHILSMRDQFPNGIPVEVVEKIAKTYSVNIEAVVRNIKNAGMSCQRRPRTGKAGGVQPDRNLRTALGRYKPFKNAFEGMKKQNPKMPENELLKAFANTLRKNPVLRKELINEIGAAKILKKYMDEGKYPEEQASSLTIQFIIANHPLVNNEKNRRK